jgi:hypothetical protein
MAGDTDSLGPLSCGLAEGIHFFVTELAESLPVLPALGIGVPDGSPMKMRGINVAAILALIN